MINAQVMEAFIGFLSAVVVGMAGLVTKKVVNYLQKKGIMQELEHKKELVNLSVNYAEQVFYQLNGPEKFDKALEKAAQEFRKAGLPIDSDEIRLMIEAAVSEINKTVNQELKLQEINTLDMEEK